MNAIALDSRVILTDEEIADTAKGFSTYGLQAPKPGKARATAKAAPRRAEKRRSSKR